MKKISPIVLLFLFFFQAADAQNWVWATTPSCNVDFLAKNGIDGHLIKRDADNNLYVTGFNQSDSICFGSYTLHLPGSNELKMQAFMVKYDSSGSVLWAQESVKGSAAPFGITIDNEGNIYEFGFFESDSVRFGNYVLVNPEYDTSNWYLNMCYYIVKYRPNGDIAWARSAEQNASAEDGGIATDRWGNIYITGEFQDSAFRIGNTTLINNSMGGPDIFFAKYDSIGNPLWAKNFSGPYIEYAGDVVVGVDDHVYVSGAYESSSIMVDTITISDTGIHNRRLFVTRLDTAGNVVWVKTSKGGGTPLSICADNINGVYIGGQFFDWTVSFDTFTFSLPHQLFAGFLIKYDTAGTAIWVRPLCTLGSDGQNVPVGLCTDPCNNVWISGTLDGAHGLILDSTTVQYGPAYSSLYIAAFSQEGSLQEHYWVQGNYLSGLAATTIDDIYVATRFSQEPIILGNDTLHHNGNEVENIYCAKFKQTSCAAVVKVTPLTVSPVFTLYPNPATSTITIQYSNTGKATASIYDITGRIMGSYPLAGSSTTIFVQNLPPGIYQCRIMDGQHNVVTKKLVILH